MTERNLSFFMKGQAEEAQEQKVYVSKRFKEKDGDKEKIIPFIMKAVPTPRVNQLAKECMKKVYENGREIGEELDRARYYTRIAIESTVYPDFKNQELAKSYGVVDPVELSYEVLSVAGEHAEWIKQAQKVNGFFEDFEALVEEAKN